MTSLQVAHSWVSFALTLIVSSNFLITDFAIALRCCPGGAVASEEIYFKISISSSLVLSCRSVEAMTESVIVTRAFASCSLPPCLRFVIEASTLCILPVFSAPVVELSNLILSRLIPPTWDFINVNVIYEKQILSC